MRRFHLAATAALWTLSGCSGSDLPPAYRDLEVPVSRLTSDEARSRGRALYFTHCALCHGERGDGRGRRRNLSSRPRDLTDPVWRRRTSPRRVFYVVREGVQGTAMAGWKALDEGETWDVVAYVLSMAGDRMASGAPRPVQLAARSETRSPWAGLQLLQVEGFRPL